MELSDSDEEQQYKPNLTDSLTSRVSSGAPGQFVRPVSAREWSKLVSKKEATFYTNDLFTEGMVPEDNRNGDVLAFEGEEPVPSQLSPSAMNATGSHRVAQQSSTLQDRRKQRVLQNLATSNDSYRQSLGPASPSAPQQILVGPADNSLAVAGQSHTSDDSNANAATTRSSRFNNMSLTFDPTAENGNTSNSGSGNYPSRVPKPIQLEITDVKEFLQTPGQKTGPILCYIVRDKGSAKMYPRYQLFLEENKRFLLAARKRKKARTSNYVVSVDLDDLSRGSGNFYGKLRSNFVGTEFSVFDSGAKPGKASAGNIVRTEVAAIMYQYNVLGTRGPRKMTAAIPAIDATGRKFYTPRSEEDTILERMKNNRQLEDLVIMQNKPPRWNEELNAYCLNFNGRVTEASVKNFQLVSMDQPQHVILQFGKIGKNTFTMDYQWPISAFQAFSICLSSFDNKLACE